MAQALSPDTDRRVVALVLENGLANAESLERLAAERDRRLASGETVRSVAQLLCEAGLLDRTVASTLVARVRADRAAERRGGAPAQTVGPYEILGDLGRGGMGHVYRARHLPSGAIRALKVMTGAPDPESVVRFRREAETVARVGARGVVAVHDTGIDQGRLFFAMTLVPGGSLGARLRREGKIPWRDAVALAVEVALLLERCHAVGLVHRDVKPDNLLLDEEGKPWLSDFGCVRDLGASRLTETGTGLGTLSYMAPGQLRGKPADAHTDVYALAITLHELVSSARPFEGRTVPEQLAAKARPRPSLVEHGAPAALDRVLDRALGLVPGEAPPSAAEFARSLGEVLDGRKVKTGPRRTSKALIGALVLVGALGLAIFLVPPRAGPVAVPGDERPSLQDPFARVQAQLHGGLLDDAERELRGDAIPEARRAECLELLGDQRLMRGDPVKARAAFTRALGFGRAGARLKRAHAAVLAGDDRGALEDLVLVEPKWATLGEDRVANAWLAEFAPALYRRGLAGSGPSCDVDIEAAWCLAAPPSSLTHSMADFWRGRARAEVEQNTKLFVTAGHGSSEEHLAVNRRLFLFLRRVHELEPGQPEPEHWAAVTELKVRAINDAVAALGVIDLLRASWPGHPLLSFLEARALFEHDRTACFERVCEGVRRFPPLDGEPGMTSLLADFTRLALIAQQAKEDPVGTDDELEALERAIAPVETVSDALSFAQLWFQRQRWDRIHESLKRFPPDRSQSDVARDALYQLNVLAYSREGNRDAALAVAADYDARFPCEKSRKLRAVAESIKR